MRTYFVSQSNGSLERTHGTIKDLIKTAMEDNQTEWDDNLRIVCMAYNTAVHETTGYTPFELTFGKKANLPSILATTPSLTRQELVDIWKRRHDKYIERAREKIKKAKEKYKLQQDSKIVIPLGIFEPGELVLLHNEEKQHKLSREWNEPATVIEKHENNNYTILLNNERHQVHANRLKPYYS